MWLLALAKTVSGRLLPLLQGILFGTHTRRVCAWTHGPPQVGCARVYSRNSWRVKWPPIRKSILVALPSNSGSSSLLLCLWPLMAFSTVAFSVGQSMGIKMGLAGAALRTRRPFPVTLSCACMCVTKGRLKRRRECGSGIQFSAPQVRQRHCPLAAPLQAVNFQYGARQSTAKSSGV